MKKTTRKLVELPTDYLIVMMEAGYVYLTMQRMPEAREVFEGVTHLAPKSEVPVIALGNVYAAQQEFDKALKEFRKAISMDPSNALAHAHCGEILLLLNRKNEALKAIRKALSLDPEGKPGAFARALLEAIEKGILPLDPGDTTDPEDPLLSPTKRPRSQF